MLAVLFFCGQANAQTLTAKVNRDYVPVGETFMYVLDYTGNSNIDPDLSVLGKDFTIYSAYNSFYDQNVNGKKSRLRQWQVSLGALKKGEFEIPAIVLDNVKSNTVKIKVGDAVANNTGIGDVDISPFVNSTNVKLDTLRPFVQQQVNLTIILTDVRALQMENIQIADDGSNTWVIKELKNPEVKAVEVEGKPAREFRYFFALFPQKSGFLKTPEFRINGYYLTKVKGLNTHARPFGNIDLDEIFARKNPISIASPQLDVEVRPVRIKGVWWLPAKQVEMSSEFDPKNPVFKVGEAVNREIKIAARGVLESQLPDIKMPKIEGMKQYPSKPTSEQSLRGDDVISIKTISNVYIPTKEGKMTLPEIKVNWFNVETASQEVVSLPAVEIEVEKGEVGTTDNLSVSSLTESFDDAQDDSKGAKDGNIIEPVVVKSNDVGNYMLFVIAVAAFVLGIVATYLVLRPRSGKVNHKKEVVRALSKKDYKSARDHVIKWGREFYNNLKIHNLADVGKASGSKDFARLLNEMERMLYSGEGFAFDDKAFISVFEKISKKGSVKKGDEVPLPKLYE